MDWVSYYHAPAGVIINLGLSGIQDTKSSGSDCIVEIQNVLGSKFDDVLTGNSRVNTLLGDDGDDILAGGGNSDILQAGQDNLVYDRLDGGAGNNAVDYRMSDPVVIAQLLQSWPPPGGFVLDNGIGGSDMLYNIQRVLSPDTKMSLVITGPAQRVISPGESIQLSFTVSGGDAQYKATFDPTTATKDRFADVDQKLKIGTEEVAILSATPFTVGQEVPYNQALTVLNRPAGQTGPWTFSMYARPLVTTSYRITVVDRANAIPKEGGPQVKQTSFLTKVIVAEKLVVTIDQPEYTITAGQSVLLRARVKGGIEPYTYAWTADDGSQATTLSATNILSPTAHPTKNTEYTLTVRDSSPDSASQTVSAKTKVTIITSTSGGGSMSPPFGNNGGTNQNSNANGNPNNGASNVDSKDNTAPNNDSNDKPSTEVSNTKENVPKLAPTCGAGMSSWMVMANLLLLAAIKRRRQ
ncbi:MAG: hypothetical protein FWC56_01800 [Phycisphaerae bacterium]|nr:hypothetical protein [Phycisphaerae bacterium]